MTQGARFVRCACAIAAVALALTGPVYAGHDEQDDPAVVSERLTKMGFVSWRKLRWDHGFWKIEDARRENGYQYDLKLEGGTLDVVWLKREGR
jgi:hypothetical protein